MVTQNMLRMLEGNYVFLKKKKKRFMTALDIRKFFEHIKQHKCSLYAPFSKLLSYMDGYRYLNFTL